MIKLTKTHLIWTLTTLLALPMILAGGAKLAGVEALHQSFQLIGLPTWFGYFIGAAELAAGIALFLPRLAALAALGLIPIMLGATWFHLVYAIPSALPAIIFTLLSAYIARHRWSTNAIQAI